ncbi:MAG: NAD-dependent succinate-semialdehyde dehydrogenase [Neisseriaceae bacterium]
MQLQNPKLFKQQNYINGKWINAIEGKTFDIFNPFDNSYIGKVPMCGQLETQQAIEAADTALNSWKNTTAQERAIVLTRFANLIEAHKMDLAKIMTIEQGKPLKEAISEIEYGNKYNYWFAEEAKRIYGDVIPTINPDRRLIVIKEPVGVCAAITPWNFPSAMIMRKSAPALAAGCTLVIKPAESTPFSALALAVLAEEAGLPPGTINIITGDTATIGQELCKNPRVSKLSFTGSTKIGKLLMEQCSSTLKKLSLELGGNAPFIVFDDANLEKALEGLKAAKFRNGGQACVADNRVYIHDSIYDKFVNMIYDYVKSLKVGNGLDETVAVGPLINQQAVSKIENLVKDAIDHGAELLLGGSIDSCSPNAYKPTIIINIPSQANISKEEIFGPIIAIYKFQDEDEVVKLANDTSYGLAAYFYSRDICRIWKVAEKLEYGMVSINSGLFSTEVAPFGGIKQSGFSREGSKYVIEDFVNIKYMCIGL